MSQTSTAAKRPITAEDLFRLVLVGDPQASPDGTRLAWVQTWAVKDDDTYLGAIWVANADGSGSRQLTSGAYRDHLPRWSPDGSTIAFVSNRPHALPAPVEPEDEESGEKDWSRAKKAVSAKDTGKPSNQVWTIRVDGGEAMQRSNHPNGAAEPAWSPDGTQLVMSCQDKVASSESDTAPTSLGPVADERVVHHIKYRFDGSGFLERYTHLWLVNLQDGTARQLTSGPYNDDSPAWSPDGGRIAFASNRSPGHLTHWTRSQIHVVDVGAGSVTALTPDDAAFDSPAWSPDGQTIAFLGHLGSAFGENVHLWTVPAVGGEISNVTGKHDLSFSDMGMGDVSAGSDGSPVWADDSTILLLASQRGETQVYGVSVGTGDVAPRTSGAHRISGFAITGSELVIVRSMIDRPFELERWSADTIAGPITQANAAFCEEVALRPAIDLDATSGDGGNVQAWLIPPVGFDESSPARHPLILQIHGGPHAMYGYAMFHEMQLMAARGYAVVFSNPRGSAGYGQNFTTSTRGVWGEADMPDVIAAVEMACEYTWIDTERLGITGGSYGGYLTNWTIGHDHRFKAAVTQRCVSNFYSFFGTSDIGTTFGVHEFDGLPWSDAEKLLRHSPISYVDKIDTPLLILHSENDFRCPIEQAEQMFASLKYLGKDVGFVRIPEEGHELSRSGTPSRRLARLHHLIGWFDTYL